MGMATLWAFLLLVPTAPQDKADSDARKAAIQGYIEKLRSESVEAREAAAEKLADLGRTVLPDLRRALKDPDGELRGRVADVIREIARRERVLRELEYVRLLRPERKRLSIDLRDVPFPEAVRKVLHPFGQTQNTWTPAVGKRAVTLTLKDATLWQAHDALVQASEARSDPEDATGWYFGERKGPPSSYVHQNVGWVRLSAGGTSWQQENDRPWEKVVSLYAGLPPGAYASSWTVRDPEILDEKGRRLKARYTTHQPNDRIPGTATSRAIWNAFVAGEGLEGISSIRLKGSLILRFPSQLEPHEIDLRGLLLPHGVAVGGAGLEITKVGFDEKSRWWNLKVRGRSGEETVAVMSWLEDARRKTRRDAGFLRIPARGTLSSSSSHRIPKTPEPAFLIMNRVVSEVELEIPIDLPRIPVTKRRK